MQASKVTFAAETRMALNNPVLDRTKKRELRIKRLLEYIKTIPYEEKTKMSTLIAASGFNVEDNVEYSRGWTFVRRLNARGIIKLESIPGSSFKYVSVGQDGPVEITKPKEEKPEEAKVEETTEEDKPKVAIFETMEYQVVDIELVRTIEKLARHFSWETNSDSLRDFVKSLK